MVADNKNDNDNEISLKKYFDHRIDTLQSLIQTKLDDRKTLFESQLDGIANATLIASRAMDKRLEGMNEFRDTLKNQAASFITREEINIIRERLDQDVRALREGKVERAEINNIREKTESDIRVLRESKATLEGKASQTSVTIATIIAILAVIVAFINGLITFIFKI